MFSHENKKQAEYKKLPQAVNIKILLFF